MFLSKIGLFWPKMTKNGGFSHFSRTTHQIFFIFCSKHSLWSRKKWRFRFFLGNLKNGPFCRKLTKCWLNVAEITKNGGFSHISRTAHQIFLIFARSIVSGVEKICFCFWPKKVFLHFMEIRSLQFANVLLEA